MNNLKTLIYKYKLLKDSKNIPYKKVEIKKLKTEILKLLDEKPVKIDNFVIVKSYVNKDKARPYFSIYTTESWEKHLQRI
jgi:hypothetical protein